MINNLLKKGGAIFLINILGVLASILVNIVLAKQLGTLDYGYYAFSISLFTLVTIVSQLGFPTLIIKNIPSLKLKNDFKSINGVVLFTVITTLFVSLAFCILLYFLSSALNDYFEFRLYELSLLIIPTLSLLMIVSALLRAVDKPILGIAPVVIVRPVILALILIYFTSLNITLTSETVLDGYMIGLSISFVILFFLLFKEYYIYFREKQFYVEKKSLMKESLPLLLLSSVGVLNENLPVIVLKITNGLHDIALYRISALGGGILSFVILSISAVSMPQISLNYQNGDYKKIEDISKDCAKLGFFISVPILIIYIFFSEKLILYFLGYEYVETASALVLFAISRTMMCTLGIPGAILSMCGFGRLVGGYWLLTIVVSVSIGLLLSFYFGFMGMVASILIGEFLLNIKLRAIVYLKISIETGYFPFLRRRTN